MLEGFEGLDMVENPEGRTLNKDHVPIAWSSSRADCAEQCAYKYYKTYIEKITATTKALRFGSQAHDILAKELIKKEYSIESLMAEIKKCKNVDEQIYDIAPHMYSFLVKTKKLVEKDNLDFKVEKRIAITRDFKQLGYFSKKGIFLRLVVDMWDLDVKNKRLIVIDHKTNKASLSAEKVRTHHQLLTYVWALTNIFGLEWDTAHVALNFLRKGKIVWAGVTMEEANDFGSEFVAKLDGLDKKISYCEGSNDWPQEKGFWCNWCPFRATDCGFIPKANDAEVEFVVGKDRYADEGNEAKTDMKIAE